eukprot:GHVS01066413.1.p1 GENE.GHVS01066413.1~~GHVS01066413.1.p1  ORF type:complete len:334 (+),score=18.26 GHVS01066413.1:336-1337(+)
MMVVTAVRPTALAKLKGLPHHRAGYFNRLGRSIVLPCFLLLTQFAVPTTAVALPSVNSVTPFIPTTTTKSGLMDEMSKIMAWLIIPTSLGTIFGMVLMMMGKPRKAAFALVGSLGLGIFNLTVQDEGANLDLSKMVVVCLAYLLMVGCFVQVKLLKRGWRIKKLKNIYGVLTNKPGATLHEELSVDDGSDESQLEACNIPGAEHPGRQSRSHVSSEEGRSVVGRAENTLVVYREDFRDSRPIQKLMLKGKKEPSHEEEDETVEPEIGTLSDAEQKLIITLRKNKVLVKEDDARIPDHELETIAKHINRKNIILTSKASDFLKDHLSERSDEGV